MSLCTFCQTPLNIPIRPTQQRLLWVCENCMNPLILTNQSESWIAGPVKGAQDVRIMAQPGSIGEEILCRLPGAIEIMPVFPEIAQRVLALMGNPEMLMDDFLNLINQDQVIVLKILRLANSPVYGGLAEIVDLRSASTRLGMRVIANTVQAIANGPVYRSQKAVIQEKMHQLWGHALASAQCACDIAQAIAAPRSEMYFVAGLIHDVGKVLLLDLIGMSPVGSVLSAVRESEELFDEVIRSYSTLVGLHIVRRWNLPPELGISTFCHDNTESVPDDSWLPQVHTVALASAMAEVAGFGLGCEKISLLSLPSTKFLGLNDIRLAELRIDLEDKVRSLIETTA